MQLILGLLLTAGIFYALKEWAALPPAQRRKWGLIGGLGALFLLLLVLVATGRIHVVTALVAGIVPFLRRLWNLRGLLPWVRRLWPGAGAGARSGAGGAATAGGRMTVEEAWRVLGVPANASREAIISAHRRLMQRVHPDRGGSDDLAVRVNDAKEVLLKALDNG